MKHHDDDDDSKEDKNVSFRKIVETKLQQETNEQFQESMHEIRDLINTYNEEIIDLKKCLCDLGYFDLNIIEAMKSNETHFSEDKDAKVRRNITVMYLKKRHILSDARIDVENLLKNN